MKGIRIIGVGSPFGDDQLGWQAVAFLETKLAHYPHHLSIETSDRPGAALLERMRDVGVVIVIDAMKGGGCPGTIERIEPRHLRRSSGLSNHSFGVAEAIDLAEALGELPNEIILIGIEASDSTRGGTVPDWNRLLKMVAEEIERIAAAESPFEES